MDEHLLKVKIRKKTFLFFSDHFHVAMIDDFQAGATHAPRPGDELSRLPFVKSWFRTRNAIVFYLSNGTLQVELNRKSFEFDESKSFLFSDKFLSRPY